jgi:hypothetical protein
MVLVAAAAVSFAIAARQARYYGNHVLRVVHHYDAKLSALSDNRDEAEVKSLLRIERRKELFRITMKLDYAVNIPFPFLLFFSPALLWLRSRKPRPTWNELMRQPGTIACLGGVFTAFLAPVLGIYVGGSWFVLAFAIVPVAWLILAVRRRWKSEPSWLDRAGRVVGIGWIAAAAYASLYLWIGPFGGL